MHNRWVGVGYNEALTTLTWQTTLGLAIVRCSP